MAKVVRDISEIKKWIEQKQQLEVMLAWDLLERFNAPSLIGPLREMAEGALIEMAMMPRNAVDRAIRIEKGRPNMQYLNNQLVLNRSAGKPPTVLFVNNQTDLETIWQKNPNPDAQYCSDIIRLYGTCVEECTKLHPEYAFLDNQRLSYRQGDPGVWRKDGPWGRHRKTDGVSFAPDPSLTDVGLLPPQKRGDGSSRAAFGRGQRLIEKAKISEVHRFLIYQQGGQSGIELKDTSTVARINRVFGTVPAADISGTTTDTLFFLERMKRFIPGGVLDPIYYLLPAATIVAGAHHSVLEVALALSLNSKVDYYIGYYETLMPDRKGKPATQGVREIQQSLVAAEHHPYNHRMLIFYEENTNKIAGCFKFEFDLQIGLFKNFAKATDVEQRFRTIAIWPAEKDILKAWPAKSFYE